MGTSQYMGIFLQESMENLQKLNEALLNFERNPEDNKEINEIFRIVHTIKGMALSMGFDNIAKLTHKMEDVFSKFRDGKLSDDRYIITTLFECLDNLEKIMDKVSKSGDDSADITELISKLEKIYALENKSSINKYNKEDSFYLNQYDISIIKQGLDRSYNVFDIIITLKEDTILKSARAFLIIRELENKGDIIKSFPNTDLMEKEEFDLDLRFILVSNFGYEDIKDTILKVSEIDNVIINIMDLNSNLYKEKKENKNNQVKELEFQKKAYKSIRIDIKKIDNLMNMVSELVLYRTRLEEITQLSNSLELNETLEQVRRTTSEIQDLVMKIRMLPIEVVFNRFPRLIRDISVELNKDISFIIEGEDTELDRTVIDELGEPLIHLLRNAADHGIESKKKRLKMGKNETGTIKLIAYQEGTNAVIKVVDDGLGINVHKIKQKADSLGIDTSNMNEKEITDLIFTEGFSTSNSVTDLSGRGVGLNVVKTKIDSLGGSLKLVSKYKVGSTFIIKLPLTLQIIRALLVCVGSYTFAISLGFIERVILFDKGYIKKESNNEFMLYRETWISFIRVSKRLDIEETYSDKKFVVIVKIGDNLTGLLVDSLIGQNEIVIKPFGKTLKDMKEYIGATILGNGVVGLILNVSNL